MKRARQIAVIGFIIVTFLLHSCASPQKGRVSDSSLNVPVARVSIQKSYDEIVKIIEEESYYSLSDESKEKLEQCFSDYAKKNIPVRELQGELKENFILARCFPQDKGAQYYSPKGYKLFLVDMDGMYGGIGVRTVAGPKGVIIKAFIPDSPAEKDGTLQIDDEIRAVGEYGRPLRSVIGESNDQIVLHIRGPVGTKVILNIWRNGREFGDVTLTRSKIDVRLVDYKIYNNIGYLRIYSFEGKLIDDKVLPILRELKSRGVDRIILDLRNNLGGRVNDAVKLIELFIREKNKPFLTLDYKEGNDKSKKEFISTHRGEYADWKGTILVNKNSASASEIVAGALQIEGFKLFGERTYGKGSAQGVTQLSNGGGFKLTIALYNFSNGKSPEGVGLTPDREISNQPVPMNMVKDVQLDAALRYLQSVN
jgi:carboxyl-terminal processing protease